MVACQRSTVQQHGTATAAEMQLTESSMGSSNTCCCADWALSAHEVQDAPVRTRPRSVEVISTQEVARRLPAATFELVI